MLSDFHFRSFRLMSGSRSYSQESRSFYSRSSSTNNAQRNVDALRPLSSRLVDRDVSSNSLERNFDDRSFFDRRRKEFLDDFERRRHKFFHSSFDDLINDDEFFRSDFGGKSLPRNHRGQIDSASAGATRTIPVQYVPSSSNNNGRDRPYRKIETTDEWTERRAPRGENRIKFDDFPRERGE